MRDKLEELLASSRRICLLGHTRPDGDCLGSTLGWKNYLKNRYPEKEVQVYLMDAMRNFLIFPVFPPFAMMYRRKAMTWL